MTVGMVLLAALIAPPAAEVTTVDGATISGTLAAVERNAIVLEANGAPSRVPLEKVLEVRLPNASAPPVEEGQLSIRLQAGGILTCRDASLRDRTLIADTVAAGKVQLPVSAVSAIRFRSADEPIATAWEDVAKSEPERDLLVVRNADVLDRLEGTVSGLDAKNLTFLVGESRVAIDRSKEKLFGVVFGRGGAAEQSSTGDLRFRNGDRLPFASVTLKGENLGVTLPGGSEATVPLAHAEAIDFGRGKIQYLAQLEPRAKEHVSYFGPSPLDSVFDVLIDRSDAGPRTPIRIDRQVFKRGLVIHSRTKLIYRLNGEYKRFVAVAGIEQLVRPLGDLDLVISADGKELLRRNVKGSDPPLPLDLDVSGARELTIFVDFAGDMDISDHLALGDARLIK